MRWSPQTVAWARRVAEELGVKPGAVLRRAAEMGAQHLDVAAALRAEVNGKGRGPRASAVHVGEAALGVPIVPFGVGEPPGTFAERTALEQRDRASAAGVGTLPGRAPVSTPPGETVGLTGAVAAPRPAAASGAHVKLVVAVCRQICVGQPQPVDLTRARRKVELGHVKVHGPGGSITCRDPDALVDPGQVAVAR